MKRAFAILFLSIFLFNLGGFMIVFKYQQHLVRKEIKTRIKKGIPDNELHKIIFAKNETPDWVREGKEFRYGDRMFDIVNTEIRGDVTIFYCVNDIQESRLFSNLDEMVDKNMDGKNTGADQMKLVFKLLSQTITGEKSLIHISDCILERSYYTIEVSYLPPALSLKGQPPELI